MNQIDISHASSNVNTENSFIIMSSIDSKLMHSFSSAYVWLGKRD